jgi:hypothetical protein
MRKAWVFNPQTGGKKISPPAQEAVKERILEHAKRNYSGKHKRIEVKCRGALCYIDVFQEPDVVKECPAASMGESRQHIIDHLRQIPIHLCRLRHFGADRWTLAFYTYSRERYEPCIFPNGEWFGAPEDGFDIGAQYLI